jgi:hypothetical protein
LIDNNRQVFNTPFEPYASLVYGDLLNLSDLSNDTWQMKYNDNFIPIITCEQGKLSQDVLDRIDALRVNDTNGYSTLHGLLAAIWIKEKGCVSDGIAQEIINEQIAHAEKVTPKSQDILVEKYAFIAAAKGALPEEDIKRIIGMQSTTGGFGTDMNPEGHPHTTSLALWALSIE